MTKRRLREWVIPTLAIFVVAGTLFLYYIIGSILNDNLVPEDTMFVDILQDNEESIEVQKEVQIIHITHHFLYGYIYKKT